MLLARAAQPTRASQGRLTCSADRRSACDPRRTIPASGFLRKTRWLQRITAYRARAGAASDSSGATSNRTPISR